MQDKCKTVSRISYLVYRKENKIEKYNLGARAKVRINLNLVSRKNNHKLLNLSLRGEAVAIPFNRKQYYVYIMTNKINTVLYTGVTSDLKKRIWEHKEKVIDGFTKNYNINKLIFFEIYNDPENAILREKQIKAGPRTKKVELIIRINPEWKDLYDNL